MNKEQKQIIKQWREVNNQYMNNKRDELKAHLQDNNKARIYAEKKNRHNVLIANEHKKKEDEMIKTWKDEIAINKGGQ